MIFIYSLDRYLFVQVVNIVFLYFIIYVAYKGTN